MQTQAAGEQYNNPSEEMEGQSSFYAEGDGLVEEEKDVRQHLTFVLGGEEYGFDILRVQEIKGWEVPTVIPNTPDYVKGVINLRGAIVPVIDLRLRFQLEDVRYDELTVVIVVHVRVLDSHADGEEPSYNNKVVGVVVDGVSDVCNVELDNIRPAPDFRGVISSDFVTGLTTENEKMVVLLDIDHLINEGIMNQLDSMLP
jgi:purine-binding chemotaxis protein CheW